MPIIYGSLLSPYVRKVIIALQLKDIEYHFQELHPLANAHKQKLRQLNPLGKIPIYQENDNFTIADSSVICAYLEKQYSSYDIYPKEAQAYAKSLWYEEYSDTHLTPTIITIFINKITALKLNVSPDYKVLQNAMEITLPEIFTYLNQEINSKKYFINNKLSIADISIASAFMSYNLLEIAIDENQWGNLTRYLALIFEEPVIKKVFLQTQMAFQEKYGTACITT
jgi:glutathione S-transferase